MDNFYVIRDGKKLKKGYTTGSTAAAAAKAATLILFKNQKLNKVTIDTPAGIKLTLPVARVKHEKKGVKVGIYKYGGDDPDITDGIIIMAKVEEIKNKSKNNVIIKGGEGVGRVTKPGLPIAKGKAAINPVPQKMIRKEVKEVLPDSKRVRIIIEIPKGVKLAKKTLNPEVGVKGGLSILGTTGIVEPMSHKAYKDSIKIKLEQVAPEVEEIILVFGNYGEKKAVELGYAENRIVKMSNYVGFMLDKCLEKGIKKVVIVGHLGKLVKVAGGIFNTHSKVADSRLEIMAAYTASCGGGKKLINEILEAVTTEEAFALIKKAGFTQVFKVLAEKIVKRCRKHVKNQLKIKTIIFTFDSGVLAEYGPENEVISDA
ncbi:MAG: cobalt-precorrin-5B (C(1))-methyltransferase CbiD [Halanaerobiales bacterium]